VAGTRRFAGIPRRYLIYCTSVYLVTYVFNRRWVGRPIGWVIAIVGGTNGIWIVFPLSRSLQTWSSFSSIQKRHWQKGPVLLALGGSKGDSIFIFGLKALQIAS